MFDRSRGLPHEQQDKSESGWQSVAVRLIKVYLLTYAHVDVRSGGSFERKSQGLCDVDIVEGRTKRSVVLIEQRRLRKLDETAS